MTMTFGRRPVALLALVAMLLIIEALATLADAQHTSPQDIWKGPPPLDTFASYEDMHNYFANRNQRQLRYLDNPTDDSYIHAFNQHNEQLAQPVNRPLTRKKRNNNNEKKLPTEPIIFKFEMADAVEPSDEVKELIRQHRSREMKKSGIPTRPPSTNNKTVSSSAKSKSKSSRSGRNKRSANQLRQAKQPRDFQVQLIKFEASDAREPDEHTKAIIKRMRAMELEQVQNDAERLQKQNRQNLSKRAETTTIKTPSVTTLRSTRMRIKKTRKRMRRAAPHTPPQMIKFELEDARDPDPTMRGLLQQNKIGRKSKDLKNTSLLTMETTNNKTNSSTALADTTQSTASADDQSNQESKRFYMYKEAPQKTKKSLNSLPHEVQKVITHLLKENHGAKAYVKSLPLQPDISNLKAKSYSAKLLQVPYGAKLQQPAAGYVKYSHPQKKSIASTDTPASQVYIHQVPVVEKFHYVYTPVGNQQQKHAGTVMSHPIVVPEQSFNHHALAKVHHTYATADLSHLQQYNDIPHGGHVIKDIPAPHFKPSKPDPLLEENNVVEGGNYDSALPIEHYKYELYSKTPKAYLPTTYAVPAAQASPFIKIEYHAPAERLKDNYKELQEFKELSALMGKSPEDQIHGLTYLLAKDMQTKLHLQRQQKRLENEVLLRPQDSTGPMLFPVEQQPIARKPNKQPIVDHAVLGVQPGKLIGMAKSKDYIPILENAQHKAAAIAETIEPTVVAIVPQPNSYIQYGLSSNYESTHADLPQQEQSHKILSEQQLIHHPTVTPHGLIGVDVHNQGASELNEVSSSSESDAAKLNHGLHYDVHKDDIHGLQYASKYAFGYRIRDFHTGNDFGHKQNRDLDGVTRGQYHILLPDGRIQNVIYHADDTGFHADVSFETGH